MEITLISVNDVAYDFGIRVLTSYLKKQGHRVNLVFLPIGKELLTEKTLSQLLDIVKDSSCIGVSVLTHSVSKAVKITQFLKNQRIQAPIIWGGIHPTSFPDEALDYADAVCLGEGEEVLAEILGRIERNEDFSDVRNLVTRDAGTIRSNPPRPQIADLDELPFQDYSVESEYVASESGIERLTRDTLKDHLLYYPFKGMGYVYITLSSRGCPFPCTFCCNNVIRNLYRFEKNIVRRRSVSNVVRELEEVKRKFDYIQFILFEDDSFITRPISEIEQFCNEYSAKVNLPFGIEMNPNEVSEDKLVMLKKAGLSLVHVGIQSGDDNIRRKYYHRITSEAKILESNRVLTKLDITHKYDIIVDTPFEGDSRSSLMLLRKFNPLFSINMYSLKLYPGLALDEIIRKGEFHKWLKEHEVEKSFYEIISDDPHVLALSMYKFFPATRLSFAISKMFNTDPALFVLKWLPKPILIGIMLLVRITNKIANGSYFKTMLKWVGQHR